MGRKPGSKNKRTIIIKKKNIFSRLFSKQKVVLTNEDLFIRELSEGYLRWKEKGEQEYSQVYKMLLNKFTNIN